ncbi:MAG: hypothetical protein COT73_07085 [Bdellovibrio sp. CG10_big_fil_rev_8_21_14_0_10_47_8]|nr:MAG: hypothetical protein COT73_07085 [Bdellovibrio sp. CG10_big_fil_rev_8_21_14_0_10_47_8]
MSGKKRGTNSIILLAFRILPQVKFSFWNFIIPIVGAVIFAKMFPVGSSGNAKIFLGILPNLLAFDGAVLGLILGLFGIYGSIESNQRTLFAICHAPEGGRFSYFKQKLITVFKMCFWVFFCSAGLTVGYVFLSLGDRAISCFDFINQSYRPMCFAFAMAWFQIKLMVELKIYLFSMYQRTVNEARALAVENKQTPFDTSID